MGQLERKGEGLQIFAPAKINLFLHVVGKRPDGFHELETLMAPISLGDDLIIDRMEQSGVKLICSDPTLTIGPDNLICRAIALFQDHYGWREGIKVRLTKRIPVGAGLGGGSGNAAATLLGLRTLSGLSISDDELAALAGQLGSDTAFFIKSRPAICRGRGELIEPIILTESYSGLLINPGFGVSTPWAYQAYAKNPRRGREGKEFAFGKLRNDLEPPVFEKYLWIAAAKQWLQGHVGVVDALMSGSGSSVFAILPREIDSAALVTQFKEAFGASMLVIPIQIN